MNKINKPKHVNILGTKYKIIYQTKEENKQLFDCRGYVEFYTKEIFINSEWFEDTKGNKEGVYSDIYKGGYKTLRHELLHAFIFESGLWNNCDWANNEEMTDWIAMQIPKISKCFKKLNILK